MDVFQTSGFAAHLAFKMDVVVVVIVVLASIFAQGVAKAIFVQNFMNNAFIDKRF